MSSARADVDVRPRAAHRHPIVGRRLSRYSVSAMKRLLHAVVTVVSRVWSVLGISLLMIVALELLATWLPHLLLSLHTTLPVFLLPAR